MYFMKKSEAKRDRWERETVGDADSWGCRQLGMQTVGDADSWGCRQLGMQTVGDVDSCGLKQFGIEADVVLIAASQNTQVIS